MSNTLEERVYANYRSTLNAQIRSVSSRAGARKQKARVITSQRYNIPVSQVKSIVKQMDEVNGITHEHTEAYSKKLAFEAAAEKLVEEWSNKPACPSCKENPTGGNSVRIFADPLGEIYEEVANRPILCCYDCYKELEAEV